jgi:hypothetical protein
MIAARGLWLERHPLPNGESGLCKDATSPAPNGVDRGKARRNRQAAKTILE